MKDRKSYLENRAISALYNFLTDDRNDEVVFKEVFEDCENKTEISIVSEQIGRMARLVSGGMHE